MDNRTKMLIATVQKLYKRGATENIKRMFKKSHIADIAVILESFPPRDLLKLFQLEEDESRHPEILSYLSESNQRELLIAIGPEEARKLVSQMESDDAADALSNLPDELSAEILSKMDHEDSVDVADLMGYPEDSAGGLMSSDFFAVNLDMTVGEAISALQAAEDDLISFYVYVVNEMGDLSGVLSLKQLLLFKPSVPVHQIMSQDVISAKVDLPQDEVARMVEKYDFLSIPVTDESNHLVGVITVDDVIDVIREETEEELLAMGRVNWSEEFNLLAHLKARIPWMLLTFGGGGICFALVSLFLSFHASGEEFSSYWKIAAFIPMILTMGATAGNQAVTVAVGLLRGKERFSRWKHLWVELQVGILMGFLFASLVVAGFAVAGETVLGIGSVLAGSLFFQVLLAVCFGAAIPLALNRIQFDPTIASVPIATAIADVMSILVLFTFAYSLGVLV